MDAQTNRQSTSQMDRINQLIPLLRYTAEDKINLAKTKICLNKIFKICGFIMCEETRKPYCETKGESRESLNVCHSWWPKH